MIRLALLVPVLLAGCWLSTPLEPTTGPTEPASTPPLPSQAQRAGRMCMAGDNAACAEMLALEPTMRADLIRRLNSRPDQRTDGHLVIVDRACLGGDRGMCAAAVTYRAEKERIFNAPQITQRKLVKLHQGMTIDQVAELLEVPCSEPMEVPALPGAGGDYRIVMCSSEHGQTLQLTWVGDTLSEHAMVKGDVYP